MPRLNGFIAKLKFQYEHFLKSQQHYLHKKITKYILIVRYDQSEQITTLRLRTIDDLVNDEPCATVRTTLHPVSYIQKLLNEEIARYAKKGIVIEKYTILNFSPQKYYKV